MRCALADPVPTRHREAYGLRSRWWLPVGVLVVAALVGVLTWALLRPDGYLAPVPETTRPEAEVSGAARTLDALTTAISRTDPDAAAALGADGNGAISDLLRSIAETADRAGVVGFAARYLSEDGLVAQDGSWHAQVRFRWRFEQYDDRPSTVAVRVRFTPQPDGSVAVSEIGGGTGRSPLWLTDTVEVRRSDRVLVLAARKAGQHFQLASHAIPVVEKVVPDWQDQLVVEVPRTAAALDSALGTPEGSYAEVAAVAASVDGTTYEDSPIHIFVNPKVFGELDRTGAEVLMAHEATHVATGAALAEDPPTWLVEGFADYVALRDVDLPLSTTAGQVIQQVREGKEFKELPDRDDFDPVADHLGATYEAAWLAARVLARHSGEDALVRVYERVIAGEDLEPVLEDETGMTVEQLTELWRVELEELAR